MSDRILVGTRKGTFFVEKRSGKWTPRLAGHAVPVTDAVRAPAPALVGPTRGPTRALANAAAPPLSAAPHVLNGCGTCAPASRARAIISLAACRMRPRHILVRKL